MKIEFVPLPSLEDFCHVPSSSVGIKPASEFQFDCPVLAILIVQRQRSHDSGDPVSPTSNVLQQPAVDE